MIPTITTTRNKENIEIFTKDSSFLPSSTSSNSTFNNLNSLLICEESKNNSLLWIGFGCVPINSIVQRQFSLYNPKNSSIIITILKCPLKYGITLTFGEDKQTTITLQGDETIQGTITWESNSNVSLREDILLQVNSSFILTIRIHGFGGIGEVIEPLSFFFFSFLIGISILLRYNNPQNNH